MEEIIQESIQNIYDCCDGLLFKINATEHEYIIPKYQWTDHLQLLEGTFAESTIKILEGLRRERINIEAESMASIKLNLMNTQRDLYNESIDQTIQLLKSYIN